MRRKNTAPGTFVRLLPPQRAALAKSRPELLEHGVSYATNVVLSEALGVEPPPPPGKRKAAGVSKRWKHARTKDEQR